ncbi:hypothetical protein QBC40DRAFT_238272 [Triangularia verruculosa]|uniref:Uncharacterized protein n=1 Tax=Triangularia verruculosa TaxID=2587418 RepID=A0AAN7AMU2_9PEZI|nr:hypothetical protein QBC40DRAFT_238272 [Triangularia verruculosa]
MAPDKAPSAGTKINLGSKAPVTHESAGTVDPSSLAASSIRSGGAFSENPTNTSPGQPASSAEYYSSLSGSSTSGTGTSSNSASLESAQMSQVPSQSERGQKGGMQAKSTETEESKMVSPEGQGGKAPTYVENVIHETGGRPHGKNLTEGGFEGSGTEEGAWPEPGSENDPGRAALRGLVGGSSAVRGVAKGVKESKGFGALGNEESA